MIWCVEDDNSIRELELYALKSTGFEARGFADSVSFFKALETKQPDLIILDIMLPNEDGVQILKRLKNANDTCLIPVIMATAKGQEYDKVQSLDLGADDYLVKPFGMMEMVSRVKAVLRRAVPKPVQHILKVDELIMNLDEHRVFIKEETIHLTYKEYEILKLFLQNPGLVFTREQLMNEVWGMDYVGETRTVDMHIRTLRQKLGAYGEKIKTIRNVGYRMEVKS